MYALLNGVGKSHVARELRRSLPGSAIADPEWVGFLCNTSLVATDPTSSMTRSGAVWQRCAVHTGRNLSRMCRRPG
jgi:hypothetical protein